MPNYISKSPFILVLIAIPAGLLVFLALAFAAYFFYSTKQPVVVTQEVGSFMRTEAEFRDKLTSLNIDKNKVENSRKRLTAIKKATVVELRDMGIKSGDDYLKSDDRATKLKVLELQSTINDIKRADGNIEMYESAIDRIRSMLARFERERVSESAALTEAQAVELDEIIMDLDDKLEVETDIFEDEELKNLLDSEMVE